MVPEVRSETDRTFCHFVPFFALSPTQQPQKSKFEKTKRAPEDVITSHMCTENNNHMMYDS